jgi:hypothetical protein
MKSGKCQVSYYNKSLYLGIMITINNKQPVINKYRISILCHDPLFHFFCQYKMPNKHEVTHAVVLSIK